nr:hypothetical protein [Micromonospora sp. DSM 115978]
MSSRNSTGPKRNRAKSGRPDSGGDHPAAERKSRPGRDRPDHDRPDRDWPDQDWADEAARARTADDPRRVTPHDQSGVPSTGDSR